MTSGRRGGSAAAEAPVDAPLDVSTMDPTEGVELDFSVVKDREAVPDQKPYLALVTKMEFGKASSGHGKCAVELTVQEPPFYADRVLTQDYSTQPQALYRLFNLLVSCGEDPEKLKEGAFKIIPSNYLGSAVVVISQDNEYEGAITSRIRRTKHASTWEESTWDPSAEVDSPAADEAEGEGAAF